LVGIKAEDLDWASGLGKKYGDKEELDGRGDAARHLALGWLAANAESPSTARRAIQAREYLDTDYIRELLGGKFAGKEMDLRNNELGMSIPAQTREEAERFIERMIESKEATFMTPQESYEMRGYADGGEVEELQKQKLREAAFDNEFAIEVAAQSNYAADIDPSVARYHGLEGVSGDRRMTLGGFTVPPEEPEDPYTSYDLRPYGFRDPETNRRYVVPVEPNTVNAVHSLATPEVWAHEYRHRQYPNMSEFQNRLIDAATAQNERQWNEAVRMWQDQLYRAELRRNEDAQRMPMSEAEEHLLDKLLSRDRQRYYLSPIFKDEYDRGARLPPPEGFLTRLFSTDEGEYVESRLQNAYFMKRAKELENLREYSEDLPEQNRDRADEAAVRNYANGGGVAALAPRATGMFNGPQINKGVGAYAPLTRRRA
jgi:hypothetical protein